MTGCTGPVPLAVMAHWGLAVVKPAGAGYGVANCDIDNTVWVLKALGGTSTDTELSALATVPPSGPTVPMLELPVGVEGVAPLSLDEG
ncbi:MAG TPA: hypothetical protein VMW83_09185 [Spirochaetia bacterium]|nr:hypothetical protein [Spirochaetia bacterium]